MLARVAVDNLLDISLLYVFVNDCYLIFFNIFLICSCEFFFCSNQICVVLDLWAFFIYCWGFYGLRLWWKVTMCLSLDIYEGLYEGTTSINLSEASRSTNECWCLLDALRWPPCNSRVWPYFMLLWTYLIRSHYRHTPTREGGAAIWVCSNDSSILCGSKTVLRRHWW